MSWSELGGSWSEGSNLVGWEQAGVRGASWSELGASWSKGSELQQAGVSWG